MCVCVAYVQRDVLGIILRRHDNLCGLLVGELSKLKSPAATADAQLTVLANWIEDQVSITCASGATHMMTGYSHMRITCASGDFRPMALCFITEGPHIGD